MHASTLATFRRNELPYTTWSSRAASLDALFAQVGPIDRERECLALIELVDDLCADRLGDAFGVDEKRHFAAMIAALERLAARWRTSRSVHAALKKLQALGRQLAAADRSG